MKTYDGATFTVNGRHIAVGSAALTPGALAPTTPHDLAAAATGPIRFEAHLGGTLALDAFVAPKPAPVNVTMAWGILGRATFAAWVDGATMRQTQGGASCDLDIVPDERALRRADATIVQRAIMHRPARIRAVTHAFLTMDRHMRDLADTVLRKRGERKKRRAMRRLLRAAGVAR